MMAAKPPSALRSVLAALLGVQSEQQRKTDFQYGSLPKIILLGVVMIVLFVLLLIGVVSLVT
nr:DUF2970 domain-containing protein [Aliagarivorans taiwanensis]